MSIKRIQIDGRLGSDATIETSKAGKRYMRFSIAHDEYENGKNVTEWYSVVIMSQEMISYYENKNLLKKGNHVLINGSFKIERRVNREGVEKNYTTIFPDIIDNIFSGRAPEGQGGTPVVTKSASPDSNTTSFTVDKPARANAPAPSANPMPSSSTLFNSSSDGEDDLPF